MAKRIRCRCPVCGILVTQERLNEEHEFEFIIHEVGSRGRGKIYNIYRKPDRVEGEGFHYFKAILARKLQQIADRLLEEVRVEVAKGREAEVIEEALPDYETDDYEELVPSSQLSSSIDYDEPVITELEPENKLGGEEEWQCSGEVSPQTVLED